MQHSDNLKLQSQLPKHQIRPVQAESLQNRLSLGLASHAAHVSPSVLGAQAVDLPEGNGADESGQPKVVHAAVGRHVPLNHVLKLPGGAQLPASTSSAPSLPRVSAAAIDISRGRAQVKLLERLFLGVSCIQISILPTGGAVRRRERVGGGAPAVLDGGCRIRVLPLHEVPPPVDVVGVHPVVVDGECVLHVLYAVVPAAGHENGLVHSLRDTQQNLESFLERTMK